ncbi:cobalt ECF transporter T component CbiQ [Thermodesulforhabdus norvegica]|uniref:Cobalt/nickel transport system permease protein n=1 Tax=Thermodesulforhabdus norvegica TaxID=39841 RepID=A0A1I4TF95_9BACT|nr:cobalt ECF transporter T component CbiQ [Thermodesulforhabdus norvegica]SFM75335.1 cobalt/nickel transport system permease protein [Thermodesulforhabdus norvegica]
MVIPFWCWAGFVILPLFLAGFRYVLFKRRTENGGTTDLITDRAIPPAGLIAGKTFFSRWDARCKIISLVIFTFFVVITDDLRVLLAELLFTLLLFFITRIPGEILLKRLTAVVPFLFFLSFFLVVLSPHEGSSVRVILEPLDPFVLNRDALVISARISLKALIVVSVMPIMIDTSPYAVTILALKSIGVPESVAQILLLAYRYIFVFKDEALRMYRAMLLRGFRPRSDLRTFRISGNFLAMIFIRSYERTQRIHDAMVARGYRGKIPRVVSFKISPMDIAMAVLWVCMGVAGWIWSLATPF